MSNKRRGAQFQHLAAVCSIVAASLLLVAVRVWAQDAARQPNIVFILTDDERLEDIQHMPKLQHLLVDQGMSFNDYVDTVSLCCPSRTSILRGQYAHNTGVMTNGMPNGGFGAAHQNGVENSTIATWLHDAGYETGLVGKYLNHYPGRLGPSYIPPGWDYWTSAVAGNPYSEYNYTLNENGKQVAYGNTPADYGTDVYKSHAVKFIKKAVTDDKPFFLYLAVYAPHGPATRAPRHDRLFTDVHVPRSKAFNESDVSSKPQYIQKLPSMTPARIASADAYYGKRLRSLQAVDEAIETVLQTLKETKQLNNTYIVFASDNGFHLGEHRLQRGKQTAYETDIHLPLIVRGPGIASGARATQLAGNIDLAPTFADMAGARTPDFIDGRSLLPILHARSGTALKWRQVFLVEHWNQRDAKPAGVVPKTTSTTTDCSHSLACTMHCAHSAACYCERIGNGGEAVPCQAAPRKLAALQEEEDEQEGPAKTPAAKGGESAAPETEGKPRRGRRRRGAGKETSKIPEYHALRSNDSAYVEYVTGETEYYKITDDPDEINNLAAGAEEKKCLLAQSGCKS